MAATLMKQGKVDRVIVGADRVAINGDFANKIGTYSLSVLCHVHDIPFHCAAPFSTVDFDLQSGDGIEIEQRKASEVQGVSGYFGDVRWAPEGAKTYNPAFDVTPVEYMTSLITDQGNFTKEELEGGVLKEKQ